MGVKIIRYIVPVFTNVIDCTKDRPARVAIYINKTNPHIRHILREDLIQDPDILAVDIWTDNIPRFTAVNLYNQRVQRQGPYTLERIEGRLNLPARSLLLGDFNAHHHLWDSTLRTSRNSDGTIGIIERFNLGLVNEPDIPTHFPRNGNKPSVIDLAFASYSLLENILNWSVEESESELAEASSTGSDHTVIRFEIVPTTTTAAIVPDPRGQMFNWKGADWELFSKNLAELAATRQRDFRMLFAHAHVHSNLDEAAELLRDTIL